MAPENADDSDADCGLDTTAAERQMAESLAGRRGLGIEAKDRLDRPVDADVASQRRRYFQVELRRSGVVAFSVS
jgi:hypothetical protein